LLDGPPLGYPGQGRVHDGVPEVRRGAQAAARGHDRGVQDQEGQREVGTDGRREVVAVRARSPKRRPVVPSARALQAVLDELEAAKSAVDGAAAALRAVDTRVR